MNKPLMVYDGNCGFCKYWLVKWKKISRDEFDFEPYQKAAPRFNDISESEFKKAVQLILLNGNLLSGAEAAYYTYFITDKFPQLYKFYSTSKWFRKLSDGVYSYVAKNRSRMFRLTKFFFGPDPEKNSSLRFFSIIAGIFVLLFLLIKYS